jgi:hypothetical protein
MANKSGQHTIRPSDVLGRSCHGRVRRSIDSGTGEGRTGIQFLRAMWASGAVSFYAKSLVARRW